MNKYISIGITAALMLAPSLALAKDSDERSAAGVKVETSVMGTVNASGEIEVHGGGSATSSNAREDNDGDERGGIMKNFGTTTAPGHMEDREHGTSTKGNATSSAHRKYGWGFLVKWFGSHDEGPVGMNASSTPSENAPRAERFETFLDKIMNIFKLDFFLKGKVE